mgnify:CR=1 FL=1
MAGKWIRGGSPSILPLGERVCMQVMWSRGLEKGLLEKIRSSKKLVKIKFFLALAVSLSNQPICLQFYP